MSWQIAFSKEADKFLASNKKRGEEIVLTLNNFCGKN